ncbi:MAG: S1 RNA-binding domain-containing protein [Microgenomates group bacterium]
MSKKSKFNHQSSEKSAGNSIMDKLMSSYDNRRLSFNRGEQVTGEVINITDSEIILDLKAKAEGVLSKKDLSSEKLQALKVGDKLDVFVVSPETESGQIIVSMFKQEIISSRGGRGARKIDMSKWQKFIQGRETGATYSGEISEINRGGLIVSIDGIRGFIPSSQVSLKSLNNQTNLSDLVGKELRLSVIEVDPNNNKLVFSSRPVLKDEEKKELASFKVGDEVTGKILAVTPFGLFLDIKGTEGIIYPQETTWEQSVEGVEIDLTKDFKPGVEVTAKITGIDDNLGRLNLSIRQMSKDPFAEEIEKYQVDDVITGTVSNISQNGVDVKLQSTSGEPKLTPEVMGFLPIEKMEGQAYQMGQKTNFLVDSIDQKNRRINLAPFLTSTVGLIYK